MKNKIILFLFAFFILNIAFALSDILVPNHYEINNIGYVDEPSYRIEVNPLHSYGNANTENYVHMKFQSYVTTDLYNLGWGFNTALTYPEKAELKQATPSNITYDVEKEIRSVTDIQPSSAPCNIGNERYNTQKYIVTYEEGIKVLCFNSYTQNGTDYKITYTDYYTQDHSWLDISSMFVSEDIDFNGKNKFYFLNGISLQENVEYELRIKLKILDNGKFDFLYYPSSYNTVYDAYNDNAIFYIDPTYNITNMISYWNLNQNTNDSIGSNNGTGINVTYESNSFDNYHANFSGNGYITVGANKFENVNGTWAFWFKALNGTGQNNNRTFLMDTGLLNFILNGNQTDANVQLGKISFNIYSSGSPSGWNVVMTENATYRDNNWYFITGTYSQNGLMRLYINGNLVGNASYGSLDTSFSRDTRFGSYFTYFSNSSLYGSLDGIMAWSRALNQSEILKLYNSYTTSILNFNVTNVNLSTNTLYQTYNTLIGNCKAINTSMTNLSYANFEYLWYKNGALYRNDTNNSNNYSMNISINAYNLTTSNFIPSDTITMSCRAKSFLYGNTTIVYTDYVNSTPWKANDTFYTTSNMMFYRLKNASLGDATISLDNYCLNLTCNTNAECITSVGGSTARYCYNMSISVDNKVLYENESNLNCYADFNIGTFNSVPFNAYWYNNTDSYLTNGSSLCDQGSICTIDTIDASEIGTNNGIYCNAKVYDYEDDFFYITANNSLFKSDKAYKGSIGECGTARPYRIFDIKYYDEITRQPINATNTYSLNFDDGTDIVNLNGTFPVNSTNSICTSINASNQSISWQITGQYIISKTDYITRVISRSSGTELTTNNLNATTENIYLIGVDNSSTITFTWRTPFYEYINGQMLIYSCDANNSKSLIDTVNINSGTAVSNLQLLSQTYYYEILYNGEIITDTDTFSKCHVESKTDVTYLVDISTVELKPVLGLYLVDCGVEEVANHTVKMMWSVNTYDTSDIEACIVGERLMPSGRVEIYRNCSTGSSGSFIRSVPNNEYSYYIYGEVTQNGNTRSCMNELQFITENNASKNLGIDGVFAIILVIVSILLMFSDSGIKQLAGVGIGIFVVYLLGILSFPINSIIAIIVFLVIIGIIGRLSRRN